MTIDAKEPQLLSIPQAAEKLGMSYSWLRKRVDDGKMPFYRIGGRILISTSDLTDMLARNRVEATIKEQ